MEESSGREVVRRAGRPRSARAGREIMAATRELLGEVGFERVSIEAVAARAGVGKTTVYRRWGSKEELVANALDDVSLAVEAPDTGNFWGDANAVIEEAARYFESPFGRQTMALISGAAADSPRFKRIYWTKYIQPHRSVLSGVLARARERGEIKRDADLDLVLDLLSGAVIYSSLLDPSHAPGEDLTHYIQRAVETVMRGIGQDGDSACSDKNSGAL